MSNSFINSNAVNKREKRDTSLVKYKLRIMLIFSTSIPKQKQKRDAFRQGKRIPQQLIENNIAEDFRCGSIRYEDEQNGEYIIEDVKHVVSENSPKAMECLSRSIDNYIKSFCAKSDVIQVVPSFYVPSFGMDGCTSKLFFEFYAPECLYAGSRLSEKIAKDLGGIYFLGVSEAISYAYTHEFLVTSYNQKKINQLYVQLFALLSYYVYFYVDLKENSNWSFLKRDLAERKSILKYVEKRKIEREEEEEKIKLEKEKQRLKEEKKNLKKENRWKEEKKRWKREEKGRRKEKLRQSFLGIGKFLRCVFSWDILKSSLDFFFNYDGHLRNRIYTRIVDVLEIVGCKEECKVDIVNEILEKCAHDANPIGVHDFFDLCGYWNYLGSRDLKDFCRKWKVCDGFIEMEYISGYGAILLSDGKNYIYVFKGSDFDSYGRDWLQTNLLQGLSGFSLQHSNAVVCAKLLEHKIPKGASLWFTGHSLGGGLASAATISTYRREGYTFNAAGLNVIGTTLNKLITNPQGIFHPSTCWNRVHPYRIKGELLDTIQKTILRVLSLGTLERGYGRNSVEMDMRAIGCTCGKKHTMINFLFKEVMDKLKPFDDIVVDGESTTQSKKNKVSQITISGMTADYKCK